MEFEWKDHLSVSNWVCGSSGKSFLHLTKLWVIFQLIFFQKSHWNFPRKTSKEMQICLKIIHFHTWFWTEIFENPFECPSGFYNLIKISLREKLFFMGSTTGCSFSHIVNEGGNIKACSTRITIVRSTRFSAFSSFCVFYLSAQQLAFMMWFDFWGWAFSASKLKLKFENPITFQKSVPKICCLINFWWTLHSSVYIEHISPSNLKVKFPCYILDSWIINRLQCRIFDQNWHFTSATNEVWCDSNRHLSLPITCSPTDLLGKYAAWR
jgi:hypothetical protein